MQALLDSLNRTAKLAMDDGRAASLDAAVALFAGFRLHVHVGTEVRQSLALQAALLTLVNAGVRSFLGGVFVSGDVEAETQLGWYRGKTVKASVEELGGTICDPDFSAPTIVLGGSTPVDHTGFQIYVVCDKWGFVIGPDKVAGVAQESNPLVGVAAAGVALCEAFQHCYYGSAWAGERRLEYKLLPGNIDASIGLGAIRWPNLWLLGLGHVGQAFLWCLGLLNLTDDLRPELLLQDIDHITESSISTCLLANGEDLGKHKTRLMADRLESIGYRTSCLPERFTSHTRVGSDEPRVAIVAVDNVSARRCLDHAGFDAIVEAGVGNLKDDFTKVRLHNFPGPRKPSEVWSAADPAATRSISLEAPAYQHLLATSKDSCGTTQLAGRSVATPFVGAFLGSLICAQVVARIAGLSLNPTIDLDVRGLT